MESRCDFVIGITEPLILHRKAFVLMAFVGHRAEIVDDSFNRLIVTSLIGRERPPICYEDAHSDATDPNSPKQAKENHEQPVRLFPFEASLTPDDDPGCNERQ